MPAEIELKLAIPPAAVRALLRHPALVAARSGRGRRARLVATYFDTPDFRLAQAGIGLRLRHENGRWVQTSRGRRGRSRRAHWSPATSSRRR